MAASLRCSSWEASHGGSSPNRLAKFKNSARTRSMQKAKGCRGDSHSRRHRFESRSRWRAVAAAASAAAARGRGGGGKEGGTVRGVGDVNDDEEAASPPVLLSERFLDGDDASDDDAVAPSPLLVLLTLPVLVELFPLVCLAEQKEEVEEVNDEGGGGSEVEDCGKGVAAGVEVSCVAGVAAAVLAAAWSSLPLKHTM
mmetsp:Transcript_11093/g.22103  ORF Transcript_11093/g.22103 Transcript_11093/m.22103 type:complete len:198 (+) Transcript_11093:790-1383(+)